MKTSTISRQLTIEDMSTSSAEGFLASRSAIQDKEKALKLIVTSSRKLSELLEKHGRSGPATSTIIRLQRRVIGSTISEIRSAGYVLPTLEDGTPVILCIPAAAVGAPHQRDRIWFVAHTNSHRDKQPENNSATGKGWTPFKGQEERMGQSQADLPDGFFGLPFIAGYNFGTEGHGPNHTELHSTAPASSTTDSGAARWDKIPVWKRWPSEPAFCGRDDGLSERLDGITFPAWRAESIKAYSNAIAPKLPLKSLEQSSPSP